MTSYKQPYPMFPESFMSDSAKNLKFIINNASSFSVLDQLLLPHKTVYIEIKNSQDGYDAIKNMQVRGAPLIATVGLKSILLDANLYINSETFNTDDMSAQEKFKQTIEGYIDLLISSRPTAINLKNTMEMVRQAVGEPGSVRVRHERVRDIIEMIIKSEEVENNNLIWNGVQQITSITEKEISSNQYRIMTICNTGALATNSWGTALGVIRYLSNHGKIKEVYALETRPYCQGLRLTAYELLNFHVPFKIIADSAAAWTMKTKSIDAVIVGADQVALNGDTANKIGTYMLALLAKAHNIPFYVATPFATINSNRSTGADIPIEERPAEELLKIQGQYVGLPETPVWNPAFDVTPNNLITALITDFGNFKPNELEKAVNKYKSSNK